MTGAGPQALGLDPHVRGTNLGDTCPWPVWDTLQHMSFQALFVWMCSKSAPMTEALAQLPTGPTRGGGGTRCNTQRDGRGGLSPCQLCSDMLSLHPKLKSGTLCISVQRISIHKSQPSTTTYWRTYRIRVWTTHRSPNPCTMQPVGNRPKGHHPALDQVRSSAPLYILWGIRREGSDYHKVKGWSSEVRPEPSRRPGVHHVQQPEIQHISE